MAEPSAAAAAAPTGGGNPTLNFEVLPRDLSAYRRGNVGVDWVHRFESGRPGPHVLVNALTHGNEFCGMVAACHLLDSGVRPAIGTLTVSFANVAAYETFDRERPFESRQLVHNLNRIWSAAQLDGDEQSPELQRARALRPVVAAADHILDIHSTSQDVEPFWVYPAFARNGAVAMALTRPAVHLVMPSGLGSGTPVIQHGLHGTEGHEGVAMVVECGQHFKRSSGELATAVALPVQSDPITLAKTLATLDHISGGRVTLGVGFGWNLDELGDHNVPPGRRRTMLREYLEAMRALWTDEEAEYHGEFVDFGTSWAWPKPPRGLIPTLVGAAGNEKNFKWIARSADGWITTPGEADIEGSVALLKQIWSDAGREGTPQIVVLDFRPDPEKLARWQEIGVTEVLYGLPDDSVEKASAYLAKLAGKLGIAPAVV